MRKSLNILGLSAAYLATVCGFIAILAAMPDQETMARGQGNRSIAEQAIEVQREDRDEQPKRTLPSMRSESHVLGF